MVEGRIKSLTAYKNGLPHDKISSCINKIMGTLAFRKLADKTQVILSLSGPDVRTRLTHTIEVAKIARDISVDLGLNSSLAEAISLAHDLGHTPFGHVGERTLREIMCGCDTLEGKVEDDNFDNSGFKHNLQSFRVMNNLEKLSNDKNNTTWPYILWGAMDHTKMTYSKPYSAMDNEIYISCRHCDWVYSCYFHERKECKRNVQKKKARIYKDKEICKPWFCATLPVVQTKEEAKELKPVPGESWEDLILRGYINETYLKNIFCSQKCYLAKLWEHKIKNITLFSKFSFLFDHPFPNSFYAKDISKYFFKSNNKDGWISVEAQIVKQSDEIAQRQEDLEDGITKGLISFKNAQDKLIELVNKCKFSFKSKKALIEQIRAANNTKKIGAFIIEFYSGLLKESTKYNFKKFADEITKQEGINIYCMMYLIYSLSNDERKKKEWMLRELERLTQIKRNYINISSMFLKKYFDVETNKSSFFFIVYYHIDSLPKKSKDFLSDIIDREIFIKYIDCLGLSSHKKVMEYKKSTKENDSYSANIAFMETVEIIRGYLAKKYPPIYKDFFLSKEKKYKWKFGHLNLPQFYALHMIYIKYVKSGPKISCIQDLVWFCKKNDFDILPYSNNNKKDYFNIWKNINFIESNQALSNIVNFVKDNDLYADNDTALKKFKGETGDIILKSEIVEKHDGKATFILKRLFKAYIDNAHQLPDEGLMNILFTIKERMNEYIKEEKKVMKRILDKLSNTLPFNDSKNNRIITNILSKKFLNLKEGEYKKLKLNVSNEIEALLEEKENLYNFLRIYLKNDDKLEFSHREEFVKNNQKMQDALIEFRRIMDNSILNATPLWRSILTRGICDHIAGLTDHEAIDEYEKLYAGIMEII